MSKRNENRLGYKKTKVGWIPDEWEVVRLKDICYQPISGYSLRGANRPAKQGEHGVLKLSCIQNGRFEPNENKLVEGQEVTKLKTPVGKDTLLVSRSNTDELVGAVCFVDRDIPNIFLSDLIWEVSAFNKSDIYIRWLVFLLCSDYYRAQIVARANGTSGSMKKITKPGFLGLNIPLPLELEQKKIAEILSTWDAAIEQTRKFIDAKKRRKKALMQQLLTGRKRLPAFKEEWKEYPMGKLFEERRETNCGHLQLLAITGNQGIIPAAEIIRKDSSNADKSKYKRIVPGDIGYNTMRMWQGVSAVSTLEGIVSPAYTICSPKNKVDVNFIGYFFKFPTIINLFWRYSQGLVSDTLNLKHNNFSQIKVAIPPIKEQRRIAQVLSAADNEIHHLERKLKALEKQKRGLMQKLLTGEIRVKVNDKVDHAEDDS